MIVGGEFDRIAVIILKEALHHKGIIEWPITDGCACLRDVQAREPIVRQSVHQQERLDQRGVESAIDEMTKVPRRHVFGQVCFIDERIVEVFIEVADADADGFLAFGKGEVAGQALQIGF